MESNELKETDMKNHKCYYFDIIKIEDFEHLILIDEKLFLVFPAHFWVWIFFFIYQVEVNTENITISAIFTSTSMKQHLKKVIKKLFNIDMEVYIRI